MELLDGRARAVAAVRTVDNPRADDGWARLRGDARLLLRLFRMVWGYLVTGASIRRAYRDRERRGETYWVDEPPQVAR